MGVQFLYFWIGYYLFICLHHFLPIHFQSIQITKLLSRWHLQYVLDVYYVHLFWYSTMTYFFSYTHIRLHKIVMAVLYVEVAIEKEKLKINIQTICYWCVLVGSAFRFFFNIYFGLLNLYFQIFILKNIRFLPGEQKL